MTINEARGKFLYTAEGERVGSVDEIFDDVETRKPEWLVISTTPSESRSRVLVPVEGAKVRAEGVFVSYSAEQVRRAPEVEGKEIDQETERRLYSLYGLPYSEQRSSTGLPEGSPPPQSRRRSRGRSGGRSTTTREATRDQLYEEAKRLDIKGRSKMNKRELARAVDQARGTSGRMAGRSAKANPIEVQKFLEGVSYPTRKGDLIDEAQRQGADEEIQSTLERLPDKRFGAPTEVSEEIGNLA